MYTAVKTRLSLSSVDKADLGQGQSVPRVIQDQLLSAPTSIRSQAFLRQCYDDHKWISCACSDGAYLAIRKTINFYGLVRLTQRGGPFTRMSLFRRQYADLPQKNWRKKLAQMP